MPLRNIAFLICVAAFTAAVAAQQPKYRVYNVGSERPIDQRLFTAIRADDVVAVRILLAQGADPNANEANGWRPLIALESGPHEFEIAKALVKKGASINYRHPDGWTPLLFALNSGGASLELVRYLLSKGANVQAKMNDGSTPLHFAVGAGRADIVRLLLDHKASLTARTIDPNPNHQDLPGFAEENRVDRQFEPEFKFSGETPAFKIVSNFDVKVAELLQSAGADFKAVDANGWTILHYAAKYASTAAAAWLLKAGLDPNAESHAGYTPLHVAMRSGFAYPNESMVLLLLNSGANRSIRNSVGQTPLDLLRADVAWNLRSTNPDVANQPAFVNTYLSIANRVAKVLDPNCAPITKPQPVANKYGGKPMPQFSGRVFKVSYNHPLSTGIHAKQPIKNVKINFSANLMPNKRWIHKSISF